MSIEQLNILYINYISDQFDWYSMIVIVIVNYVH